MHGTHQRLLRGQTAKAGALGCVESGSIFSLLCVRSVPRQFPNVNEPRLHSLSGILAHFGPSFLRAPASGRQSPSWCLAPFTCQTPSIQSTVQVSSGVCLFRSVSLLGMILSPSSSLVFILFFSAHVHWPALSYSIVSFIPNRHSIQQHTHPS